MEVMDRPDVAQRVAVVLADRLATSTRERSLEEPPLSRFLFADTRTAPFWLVLRSWLGYQWLQGAFAKLTNPAWMDSGVALKGFWTSAIDVSGPIPAITYPWYRTFIEFLLNGGHYVWFAKVIALGETAVGLGLVLGLLTGAAAAGGLVMNASYLLAGSASINPVLAALEVPVILAWRVAGWWGLDRFILGPLLQPRRRHQREPEKRRVSSSAETPVPAVQ
jgi:thiosulfate dehydrogenase [quinone] large subunit